MAHFSKERYRLCKVQSKLANSCHNNDAWLLKQWDKVGARFVRGTQFGNPIKCSFCEKVEKS
ncbi:hypothetical protein pdam_00018118, partial [Pocillopora damicornis]